MSVSKRQWWSVIARFLVLFVFLEAVFAGAMLSGFDWARGAHKADATILVAVTLIAALVGIVTLRGVTNGLRLGLTLLALAAVLALQAAIGTLSAKGDNFLWLHIPLGVALFGFVVRAAAVARTLPEG